MAARNPINPVDDEALDTARTLLQDLRFGALAVTHPDSNVPYVARVAMIWHQDALYTLISTLSTHTKALQKNADCAALIGEPGPKGDPLTHPRMTIMAQAELADKAAMKDHWLALIPKAQLYFDFSDFLLYRLAPVSVHLNGGFGKAYEIPPDLLSR